MTILVTTDSSRCSITATRLAVALARRQRVPLMLFHCVEPLVVDPAATPISAEWDAAITTVAERALKQHADDLRKSGIEVEAEVRVGSAAGTILEFARKTKPDLIVMGTHGRRGPARLFLGSCAEEVVPIFDVACPRNRRRYGAP